MVVTLGERGQGYGEGRLYYRFIRFAGGYLAGQKGADSTVGYDKGDKGWDWEGRERFDGFILDLKRAEMLSHSELDELRILLGAALNYIFLLIISFFCFLHFFPILHKFFTLS